MIPSVRLVLDVPPSVRNEPPPGPPPLDFNMLSEDGLFTLVSETDLPLFLESAP